MSKASAETQALPQHASSVDPVHAAEGPLQQGLRMAERSPAEIKQGPDEVQQPADMQMAGTVPASESKAGVTVDLVRGGGQTKLDSAEEGGEEECQMLVGVAPAVQHAMACVAGDQPQAEQRAEKPTPELPMLDTEMGAAVLLLPPSGEETAAAAAKPLARPVLRRPLSIGTAWARVQHAQHEEEQPALEDSAVAYRFATPGFTMRQNHSRTSGKAVVGNCTCTSCT
jgi:hypothetical protein